MGKIRQLSVNILLLCTALFVGLAMIELTLRIGGVEYPLFLKVDPDTGFNLRPNARGWHRTEGEAYVRINSHGMRDIEHMEPKAPDTYRIAIVGDSFAEARQVDIGKTFWKIAEKELSSCPLLEGIEVEVLNFGVSGFGTAQELLQMRTRVERFDPDDIVLAFTSSNDIVNNSFALAKVNDRPYVRLEGDKLIEDFSFRETDFFRSQERLPARMLLWTLQRSRVAQLLNHVRKAITGNRATVPEVSGAEQGIAAAVYSPPTDDAWRDAWLVTERLLAVMRDEAEAAGASFMILTTTSGIQVHPDPAVREEYMQQNGIEDLFYPDTRIASVAALLGIPVFIPGPEMQRKAEESGIAFHGFENTTPFFGHWNEEGHREAGERLAAFICADLLE